MPTLGRNVPTSSDEVGTPENSTGGGFRDVFLPFPPITYIRVRDNNRAEMGVMRGARKRASARNGRA